MGKRQHQHLTGRVHAWQLALALLAIFAMGAQQLVAQTHWHNVAVAQAAAGSAPAPDQGHSRHDSCLLCQIASHASAAAPPTALLRLVPVREFSVRVAEVPQLDFISLPAHDWQSRGPPTV
jgi:hypothetical protein